jgi:hypothetical protein
MIDWRMVDWMGFIVYIAAHRRRLSVSLSLVCVLKGSALGAACRRRRRRRRLLLLCIEKKGWALLLPLVVILMSHFLICETAEARFACGV